MKQITHFVSSATLGERDDARDVDGFGQKFLGVKANGTIEIHGEDRVTWTKLTATAGPSPKIFTNINDQPDNSGIVVYEFNAADGALIQVNIGTINLL